MTTLCLITLKALRRTLLPDVVYVGRGKCGRSDGLCYGSPVRGFPENSALGHYWRHVCFRIPSRTGLRHTCNSLALECLAEWLVMNLCSLRAACTFWTWSITLGEDSLSTSWSLPKLSPSFGFMVKPSHFLLHFFAITNYNYNNT